MDPRAEEPNLPAKLPHLPRTQTLMRTASVSNGQGHPAMQPQGLVGMSGMYARRSRDFLELLLPQISTVDFIRLTGYPFIEAVAGALPRFFDPPMPNLISFGAPADHTTRRIITDGRSLASNFSECCKTRVTSLDLNSSLPRGVQNHIPKNGAELLSLNGSMGDINDILGGTVVRAPRRFATTVSSPLTYIRKIANDCFRPFYLFSLLRTSLFFTR